MSYIGSTPTNQNFIAGTDYFNGTGSAVNFTMSRAVNSVNDIEVLVNNVAQIPSGYLVSGTTLTFSVAPSAGTSNVYVRYLSTTNLSLAIPAGTSATFNTVTATSLTATSLTATTLAATNLSYTGTLTGNGGIVNIGSGQVYKDASGNVGIGTTAPSVRLNVSKDGAAGDAGQLVRITDTNTANAVGPTSLTIGMMNHYAGNPRMSIAGTTGLSFCVGDGSDFSAQRKVDIDSSGNLLVGTTNTTLYSQNSVNGIGIIPGTSSGIQVATDPAGSTGNASIILNMRNTPINGAKYIRFFYNGANDIGNISLNGTTAVAYNTSSDYRLKNTIAPMTGALDKVALLKPVTYKWNADGSDGQGFIAHELAEVVPDCVSGNKDAVETYTDEDGNEATRPAYQGIDTSFLVATLTAAIQEQQALITQLQADVATLKALSA